jgi:hypothetical protein
MPSLEPPLACNASTVSFGLQSRSIDLTSFLIKRTDVIDRGEHHPRTTHGTESRFGSFNNLQQFKANDWVPTCGFSFCFDAGADKAASETAHDGPVLGAVTGSVT